MRVRNLSLITGLFVAALAASPATASADWIVTPFVGWNFGSSADVSGSSGSAVTNKFNHKADYGVSLDWMGKGIVGADLDFGYSPNFFAATASSGNNVTFSNNSNVTTLTGNVIVGVPVGGHGASIRPYVVGGVGLIRERVQDAGGLFDVNSKNDFGFDVGAGLMGYFSQNVGLRGDVRYFRGFRGAPSGSFSGIALSNFAYWRASLGVSFKF